MIQLTKALKHDYSVELQSGCLPINTSVHFSCLVRGTPFYLFELAPIAIVLMFNIISLVAIMLSLSKTRKNSSSMLSMKDRFRIVVGFMIVFGITWVFGLLVINNDIIVFQYLFCITGSLQGLYIFGFYCLRNPKIRGFLAALLPGEKLRQINQNKSCSQIFELA